MADLTPDEAERAAIRRRWKREAAIVIALAIAGIVIAAVASGYTAPELAGIGLVSIAGVAGVSFVFYEIGRSEDLDRARGGRGPYDGAPDPAPEPAPEPDPVAPHPAPRPHRRSVPRRGGPERRRR